MPSNHRIVVFGKTLESLLDSKEINPEFSLEGLMLKLKLQYWTPNANSQLIGKTLMLEKTEGKRERGSGG